MLPMLQGADVAAFDSPEYTGDPFTGGLTGATFSTSPEQLSNSYLWACSETP